MKKLIRKGQLGTLTPILPSNTAKVVNKGSKKIALGGNWLFTLFGKLFNTMITAGASTDFGLTSPFVMSTGEERRNILRGREHARKSALKRIAQASPWISPSSYVAALISGNGLNASRGSEVLANSDPRLTFLGNVADFYTLSKVPKVLRPGTPKNITTTVKSSKKSAPSQQTTPQTIKAPEYHTWDSDGVVGPTVLQGIADGVEYLNRQVIPMAQQLGNWRGTNRITDNFSIGVYDRPPNSLIAGSWNGAHTGGQINLFPEPEWPSSAIESVVVHEGRHMLDHNPKTGAVSGQNPIINFMNTPVSWTFKSGKRPILLSSLLTKLLHLAYPTTILDRLFGNGAHHISEKITTNAENRKIFDNMFQEQYGRKPSVQELNTYINGLDNETFGRALINNMPNGYMDTYFGNMVEEFGRVTPEGAVPQPYTHWQLFLRGTLGKAKPGFYWKIDKTKFPTLRLAITTVPMVGGVIFGNNLQTEQ